MKLKICGMSELKALFKYFKFISVQQRQILIQESRNKNQEEDWRAVQVDDHVPVWQNLLIWEFLLVI